MTEMSTLCYIQRGHEYLMLHRVVKKNDVNKDKWIGVGGHFEAEESPEECLLREVREETGYELTSWRYRGLVTFVSGDGVTEYMSLFTADRFTGEPAPCDEGVLEWVDIDRVWKLNLWEGDKIFFRLIDEDAPFFSLKLVYDGKGVLRKAALNGRPMELFDILEENGSKSGIVRERGVAHRDGSLHGTVHIWIFRNRPDGGRDVLLQKRSRVKDSNPGCYDISAAGHIEAGDDALPAACRELREELGIMAEPDRLICVGQHRGQYRAVFHGLPFRDRELSSVYIYQGPVREEDLVLQPEEVESVRWMDWQECRRAVHAGTIPHCIYEDELDMLEAYLTGLER